MQKKKNLRRFEFCVSVLSDIHGNRWALEAVLEDIKLRRIQDIFNLGDSLYGPLDPAGTAQILVDNNIQSIRGNEDRIVIKPSDGIKSNPTLQFVIESLSSEHLCWLESLEPNRRINTEFFLCHGSPERDDEYLLEDVSEQGVFLRNIDELMIKLSSLEQQIFLCGHSHVPRTAYLPDGKLIINPGSVGLPAYEDDVPYQHLMETGTPHARYSIVSKDETGWWIENIAVPYDWKSAVSVALKNKRPDWARWLETGRA